MAAAASLVTTIQVEIERAKNDLKGVDENLRRLTGRDFNDPSSQRGEVRRVRPAGLRGVEEEPPAKRRPPGGVFARLGAVVLSPSGEGRGRPDPRGKGRSLNTRGEVPAAVGEPVGAVRRVQEVVEPNDKIPKPSLASSVARPQADSKSRNEAAAELTKDRASRDRNRRMFGALLGTLKRFQNDEAKQKDKEEQRAAIERKLEEKGRVEKEELRRERLELFNQRKERQAQIRRLTLKMARVREHEAWEAHQMRLAKFIRTEAWPRVFWMPRHHTARTSNLVRATHDSIKEELEQERQRMRDELEEILGSRAEAELGQEEEEQEEEEEGGLEGVGVRSHITRPREGAPDTHHHAGVLAYEAEEGELVCGEAQLAGKDEQGRMVVQVDGRGAGGRKVEIVAGQLDEGGGGGKGSRGGNDSEKENEGRRRREEGRGWTRGRGDAAPTLVHIKVEKEEEARQGPGRPLLNIIKEEKPDHPVGVRGTRPAAAAAAPEPTPAAAAAVAAVVDSPRSEPATPPPLHSPSSHPLNPPCQNPEQQPPQAPAQPSSRPSLPQPPASLATQARGEKAEAGKKGQVDSQAGEGRAAQTKAKAAKKSANAASDSSSQSSSDSDSDSSDSDSSSSSSSSSSGSSSDSDSDSSSSSSSQSGSNTDKKKKKKRPGPGSGASSSGSEGGQPGKPNKKKKVHGSKKNGAKTRDKGQPSRDKQAKSRDKKKDKDGGKGKEDKRAKGKW